jgi:uncharacterized membrane protein YraQ (UPF0718 family)
MLIDLLNNIWAVLLDTAFWLLLGLLAAGLIKVFIPADAMKRWVGGRGFAAVARAALFGAPLPLCSCGVLPAAIGLRRAGASKEATVSFLISTPETSVDSVAVTYALMGPVMAVYRPLAALVSAMLTGMLTALVDKGTAAAGTAETSVATSCCGAGQAEPVEPVASTAHTGCCASTQTEIVKTCCAAKQETTATSCCGSEAGTGPQKHAPKWLQTLKFAGAELIDDIAVWMAVGIVVAGAMLTFVPPGWLAQWGNGLGAMLVMLLVGIPMYICAVASTPIAAGLLLAGVSPGAVLVFLLVGPATNIASFALVWRELGNKVTLVYFAGISIASIGMGLLLEAILRSTGWHIQANIGEAHTILSPWLVWGSAILLLVLAIKPLRRALLPVLG